MNQLNIKQIIQDCFLQFYNAYATAIAGAERPRAEVRKYAINLWDVRNSDEIERDEVHGVTCIMYVEWCLQRFTEIIQSPDYENDLIARKIAFVKTTVCVWAAVDFKENAGVYTGPDANRRVEELARHQWLSRDVDQVERDKSLGIIQDDYVTWCAGEFHRSCKVK